MLDPLHFIVCINPFFNILSGLMLSIGYLMNIFTDKKQTLHDLMAKTVVIKYEPVKANYFTIWIDRIKEIFDFGNSNNVSSLMDGIACKPGIIDSWFAMPGRVYRLKSCHYRAG